MLLGLETLVRDLQMSVRGLSRRPGLLSLGATTLAIGFAGNMTVFSVLDSLLLRPHPFPALEQLVLLREVRAGSSQEQLRITPGDFLDLSADVEAFANVAAFRYAELNLGGAGIPESIRAYYVTPNLFPLLGVEAGRGRVFSADESETGRDRVVLLSHGLVQRRFPDRDMVGTEITLNGQAHTVVGVMPENLNYPRAVDVFVPLALTAAERVERTVPSLQILARLSPGVDLESASSELLAFGLRLAERYPDSHRDRSFRLLRLREEQYRYTLPMFGMLQIAGFLVLLLASANASNLVLVWRMARSRELAVRSALGAPRGRIYRQSLFECLALNGAALLLALPLAFWAVELVRNAMPQGIATWVSGWREIHLDANAFLLGVATAVVVAFAMSLAGARGRGSRRFAASLQGGIRGTLTSAGPGRMRLRRLLTRAQIALALLLLSAAVWLLQGFEQQMRAFDRLEPRGILTARVVLSRDRFPDDRDLQEYFTRALGAFAELPGVERVAAAVNLPASNVPNEEVFFEIDDRKPATHAEMPRSDLQTVAGEFFDLFRVAILRGRALSSSDDADAPRVTVVSEAWARRHLGSEEALGRRVRFGRREPEGPSWTIVGVVSDVKQNWFDPEPRPILYVSHLQNARNRMTLAFRGNVEGYSLADSLRRRLSEIDPGQALAEPVTLEDEIADSLAPLRIIGMLLLVFAGVALLLAVTGVYGVVATSVAERARELGLRMALGARPRELLRQVLAETLRLALMAVGVALPVTVGANVLLAGRLFGIVVVSPLVLAATSLLLLAVTGAAAWIPARSVTRLDPVRALRWE